MMKRTMGGVLAAAMMMMSALPAAGAVDVSHLNGTSSSTLTQAAADMLPSLSVAPMTELATVVSYENGDLTVKTADGDELVLHTENAIVMDTQTAAAADLPSRQVRAFTCITTRLSPCLSRHRLPPLLF